ncbi:MAG TPA: DNA translocase FtsK [Gemmatimonadales bacterium]|nr:DNA translocase FtsK [Gemmatimonadales bacterium]
MSTPAKTAPAEVGRRRRLGAVTALVVGLFVGLTLLPVQITGPVGGYIGHALWQLLGAGALGIPLLGIGLALAGFDRLGGLDMKRSAILIVGLSVLVPYVVGVLTHVTPAELDMDVGQRGLAARTVGLVPGFLAETISGKIGVAGAVLLGFLALSALTLATFAWHPLQRLEAGRAAGTGDGADGRMGKTAERRNGGTAEGVGERAETRRKEKEDVPEDAGGVLGNVPPFRRSAPSTGSGQAVPPEASAPKPRKKDKKPEPPATASAANEESDTPPIDLLTPPASEDIDAGEAQLDRLGQSLLETLRTFKVEGQISGRTTGPVVTQFEVVPGAGVKAGRIVALADDLAMSMRAPSIRVAPIPGKGAVGVEVPNPIARMVTLRELIESPDWGRGRAALPIALGRDLEGKPVVADLAKMPHLLIAGATGTGKSVTINTIITGLIYRHTPRELRLLMVDPKMVELSMYNALPHLRHKVVTNNHDAATVLKWAVFEMNRRYELLQANGARNLADFNRKVEEGKPLRNPPRPKISLVTISAEAPNTPPEPPAEENYTEGVLPMIVIVIDELADLMMTVQAEIEHPLAMLAQKARAIGIHLILATQRPSVNVITGLIKANFPSRIAFRVASKVDSRTILDQNGAEALLGNGDMLFLPPGKSEPMRLQGAFIGTDDSEKVMEWYVARREARRAALRAVAAEADILEMVRAQESEGDGGPGEDEAGERDALFREAAEACIQNQGGSTSLLQRRLRIGYGRAARIIDQLHYAGILGPPDGSKPREVLVGFDQLDEYCK